MVKVEVYLVVERQHYTQDYIQHYLYCSTVAYHLYLQCLVALIFTQCSLGIVCRVTVVDDQLGDEPITSAQLPQSCIHLLLMSIINDKLASPLQYVACTVSLNFKLLNLMVTLTIIQLLQCTWLLEKAQLQCSVS